MRRIILGVTVLLLGMGGAYYLNWHHEESLALFEKSPNRPLNRQERELRQRIKRSRTAWNEAFAYLAESNHVDSYRAYERATSCIASHVKQYPEFDVAPGVTLSAWVAEEGRRYCEEMQHGFTGVLKHLAEGTIAVSDFRQILSDYSPPTFGFLHDTYKREEKAIMAQRTKSAPDWLRVTFARSSAQGDLKQTIKRCLTSRWNNRYGKKLTFGESMRESEHQSTWKTLHVTISSSDPVRVTFKLSGSALIPTSWDQLPPLGGAIAEALEESLPPFQVFPGTDPQLAQVTSGVGIDLRGARALAFLDRERLIRRLEELAVANEPSKRDDMLLLCVSLHLEEMAPWVTRNLPALTPDRQREVYSELSTRPWYGDYEPLLAVVRETVSSYPHRALHALRDHMSEKKVIETLCDRINDSDYPHRGSLASFLLRHADGPAMRPFAEKWITDRDGRFSERAFQSFLNRDRAFGMQLTLQFFKRVPAETRVTMLRNFSYDPEQHGERGLALLSAAALQRDNRELRRSAYRSLERAAVFPDAWGALQALNEKETSLKRKERTERQLTQTIYRAFPDKAEAFLLDRVRGNNVALRNMAIHALFGNDGSKVAVIHAIAGKLSRGATDHELVKTAILAIHQHHRLRRNWNFGPDQTELNLIFLHGNRHPDPDVRKMSYTVLDSLLQAGHMHYRNLLLNALATEMDEKLRPYLSKLTGGERRPAGR